MLLLGGTAASYGPTPTTTWVVSGGTLGGGVVASVAVSGSTAYLGGNFRKVTWLLTPEHADLPAFLRQLRASLDAASGDTKVELAFVFEDRVAPIAETAQSLKWRISPDAFQQLRSHPAVAGVLAEARRPEMKEVKRWGKRG